ncbi:hypothetical protein B0H17DRAFT_1222954 [Mycena rosella]|uniref:Uncharacterized protein n=1 Tax=Mycena rosella TaxID=1033263 RepID=A0AAD7F5E1_MYCRO|nr:hypothetical protein B0H17DRAFT_1222954 [Mycena rosella]
MAIVSLINAVEQITHLVSSQQQPALPAASHPDSSHFSRALRSALIFALGPFDFCIRFSSHIRPTPLANIARTLELQHMDSDIPDNEIVLNTDVDIPIAVGRALFATVSLTVLDGRNVDVESFYILKARKYEAVLTDRL